MEEKTKEEEQALKRKEDMELLKAELASNEEEIGALLPERPGSARFNFLYLRNKRITGAIADLEYKEAKEASYEEWHRRTSAAGG